MTTPKRGVGGTTLEALGSYAGRRHISLFAAVFEEGFAHSVQPRQLTPLLEFCEFINALEYRAIKEPANQVMPDDKTPGLTTFGVRGLYTSMEAALLRHPNGRVQVAILDEQGRGLGLGDVDAEGGLRPARLFRWAAFAGGQADAPHCR